MPNKIKDKELSEVWTSVDDATREVQKEYERHLKKVEEQVDDLDNQHYSEGNNMTKLNELTIDINEYIQWDEDGEDVIYFNVMDFINDAKEYLQNDNPEYKIVEENS